MTIPAICPLIPENACLSGLTAKYADILGKVARAKAARLGQPNP